MYKASLIRFFLVIILGIAQVGCGKDETASKGLDLRNVKGFGMDASGGAGGRVIKVTNLNLDGEGSLRWAVSQSGPRIVVFEVGGVIDLNKERLYINEPFITIAGQTAPSPGITLIRGELWVMANNVKVQHLRIRPGDAGAKQPSPDWEPDGLAVRSHNVHIDHCSISWAVDENVSASGPRIKGPGHSAENVTFSNSIIAEGMHNSIHTEGEHSKGMLVHDFTQNIAVIGNLLAQNDDRNPYYKSHATGAVVNNIIFNPGIVGIQLDYVEEEMKEAKFDPVNARLAVVGNVLIGGQNTAPDLALVSGRGDAYVYDNIAVYADGKPALQTKGAINALSQAPVWPEGLQALPAAELEAFIVENVGARPWDRDAIDARIIEDFKKRQSRIVDSQEQVGGYPKYEATYRKLDVPAENIESWLEKFAAGGV